MSVRSWLVSVIAEAIQNARSSEGALAVVRGPRSGAELEQWQALAKRAEDLAVRTSLLRESSYLGAEGLDFDSEVLDSPDQRVRGAQGSDGLPSVVGLTVERASIGEQSAGFLDSVHGSSPIVSGLAAATASSPASSVGGAADTFPIEVSGGVEGVAADPAPSTETSALAAGADQ